MGLVFEYEDGQTPLSEEEKEGILSKTISTHGDLDELEQANIESALLWVKGKKFNKEEVLSEDFIKKLHKKMFGDVWRWAGDFRRSEKNIGISWTSIGVELRKLLDNTLFLIENEVLPSDEIAIDFKHKLVNIHCFPNGNGRHSRMMADIIIEKIYEETIFSWNSSNMVKADETRANYINAIRKGDDGDIKPLIEFARG